MGRRSRASKTESVPLGDAPKQDAHQQLERPAAADDASRHAGSAVPPPAKGGNPEQLLSSLNTAAQRVQSLWISFISFGAYLTITVLGTTHRILLLEEGVKLPIFNIDLPLTKFYL